MRRFVIGTLLLIGICSMAGVVCAQPGGKADEKAEPKPPINEVLNPLNEAFRARNDANAVTALEAAVAAIKQEDRPAKEKTQILKAVQVGLGNRNDAIKMATANALGRVGPAGAKPLVKALKSKPIRKNREVISAVIDALGLTRDEKGAVTALLKIVTSDKDWTLRALAGRALGNFDKTVASGNSRKKICEKLIQIYESIQSQASDGKDSDAVRKHTAIQGDFVSTLRTLTEEEWNSAADWRKWFNKAKRKRWPNPPKKKPAKS